MAIGGRKPTPTVLRLVTGNPGGHPMPPAGPELGPIERPAKMPKKVAELWDLYIARASWLTWASGPKAIMWCHLMAEYNRGPAKMIAARIAQLRALDSELGLGDERPRRGVKTDGKKDPTAKYLGSSPKSA